MGMIFMKPIQILQRILNNLNRLILKELYKDLLTNNPDIKESELDLEELFKDFTKGTKKLRVG